MNDIINFVGIPLNTYLYLTGYTRQQFKTSLSKKEIHTYKKNKTLYILLEKESENFKNINIVLSQIHEIKENINKIEKILLNLEEV